MESNTIQKINKLGKAGYVICKIGRVAFLIAAVCCLVSAIFMCFVPKETMRIELSTANSAVIHFDESIDYFKAFDLDIDDGILEIGQHTYKVIMSDEDEPDTVETVIYLSNIKWVLFGGVIACIAAFIAFYYGSKLCAHFKSCETPFTEDISKGLVKLAWSLIPLCVVSMFMEGLSDSLISGAFDLSVNIDVTSVLLILCVFMLSYIFKHGTALQTASDETL